jgi:hypothetical protein
MGRTVGFSRRELLQLGVTAAGATLATGCRSLGLPLTPGGDVDLATAAQVNYRKSLAAMSRSVPRTDGTEAPERGTGKLSSDPALLREARGARPGRPDFDVLIIGSGYGGAVCAARLAAHRRPGVKIGLLERGREWAPGTFPQRLLSFNPLNPFARRTSWMSEQRPDNPLGLFGFYDGDVHVVIGSGLGGASLTNCAVVLEAEEQVFRQAAWPEELRSKDTLRPYYDTARRMLSPQTSASRPSSEPIWGRPASSRRSGAGTRRPTGPRPPSRSPPARMRRACGRTAACSAGIARPAATSARSTRWT